MLASPGGGAMSTYSCEIESEGSQLLSREERVRRMEAESRVVRLFAKLYTLSLITGILLIGLVCVWIGLYRGGLGSDVQPDLKFNRHPLLMTFGLIFLYGNGSLIYRAFRTEQKKKLKIAHGSVHILAFALSVWGLKAVFDFHNNKTNGKGEATPIPNLYSMHSWIGLIVVILFSCQWLFGLTTFLFPGLRPAFRSTYLPVHQFFGVAIFVGALATAISGLNEKAIFSDKKYSQHDSEGILINFIGLLIIIYGGLVVYLVTYPLFKRRTTEEELLLTDTNLE